MVLIARLDDIEFSIDATTFKTKKAETHWIEAMESNGFIVSRKTRNQDLETDCKC